MNSFVSIGTYKNSNNEILERFEKPNRTTLKLNFPIHDPVKNSITFVSLLGNINSNEENSTIKLRSAISQTENVEIKWSDRTKKESIDAVAPYLKYRFSYIDEFNERKTKEFITSYDMILFSDKVLKTLPDNTNIRVSGKFKRNPFNSDKGSRIFNKFEIQNIYVYDSYATEIEYGTTIKAEIMYNKDSLMNSKDKDVYMLNSYTSEYINKDLQNKYVHFYPIYDIRGVKNAIKEAEEKGDNVSISKYNKIVNSMFKYLRGDLPQNGNFVMMQWDFIYHNGAEEVEINESMLTQAQLEEIAIGERTLDDFKQKALGSMKEDIKIYKKNLTGKYSAGIVTTLLGKEDVESETYNGNEYIPEMNHTNISYGNRDPEDTTDSELRNLLNF